MFIAYVMLFVTVISSTIANYVVALNGIHNLEKRIEKLEAQQSKKEGSDE